MSQVARIYDLLIIDEDSAVRQRYIKLLQLHSLGACEFREAADGAAGLKALDLRMPDCALLNECLPDMTGLEFLSGAARDGELPCATVLMSGQGNAAIAVAAMQLSAHECLAKDQLDERRLWPTVAHAVEHAKARRRLSNSLATLASAYATLEPANTALEEAMAILKREVAGRKQAEAALPGARDAAAGHAKTRFLAMTARELCKPVSVVLGHAQLLRNDGGLSAGQDASVCVIMQAAQHMLELAEGVLATAGIDGRQAAPAPEPVEPESGTPQRGRVLLVDDIEMNRDVIGGFLRAAGHEVLLAETGTQAVRLAFQKMVDVVLMDVRMPDMDGLEATRRIRALPNPGSEVPILALSAYTMRGQAALCMDAGMDGFVAKPVGYATLMRAIDDVFLRPAVLNRDLRRAG